MFGVVLRNVICYAYCFQQNSYEYNKLTTQKACITGARKWKSLVDILTHESKKKQGFSVYLFIYFACKHYLSRVFFFFMFCCLEPTRCNHTFSDFRGWSSSGSGICDDL